MVRGGNEEVEGCQRLQVCELNFCLISAVLTAPDGGGSGVAVGPSEPHVSRLCDSLGSVTTD